MKLALNSFGFEFNNMSIVALLHTNETIIIGQSLFVGNRLVILK